MEGAGPYMTDPIGKCLREVKAFSGAGRSRADKYLKESATYASAMAGRDLMAEFQTRRAKYGYLCWRESKKYDTREYVPVAVDEDSGVVRQLDTERFGLLSDVRPCLHRKLHSGDYVPWAEPRTMDEKMFVSPSQKEIDSHDPMKTKFGTVGRPGRIGQIEWRKGVARLWNHACAITGCKNPSPERRRCWT